MTPQELDAAMSELGWDGKRLSKRLGVHVNSVSKWRTGRTAVPEYVAVYLDLALKVKRFYEDAL